MQTFLPYEDFAESARCLDNKRLGKQRVETMQLLTGNGWTNHPARKMWSGYNTALAVYGVIICREWVSRGFTDTVELKIAHKWLHHTVPISQDWLRTNEMLPNWIGSKAFHDAHKSNLPRKDPVHYGRYRSQVSDDLPYVWPTV